MAKTKAKPAPTKKPAPGVDLEAAAEQARVAAASDKTTIEAVTALGRELYKLNLEVEQLNIQIAEKAARMRVIETQELPNTMTGIGLTDFSLTNGYSIEVRDVVSGSIPSETAIEKAEGPDRVALVERRKKALAWLRKNKAAELIKNTLTAEFGKGQDRAAKEFAAYICKKGYAASCTEYVHPQSLNAFIRAKRAAGVAIPAEEFALFEGRIAELKAPKVKKTSAVTV